MAKASLAAGAPRGPGGPREVAEEGNKAEALQAQGSGFISVIDAEIFKYFHN